MKLFLLFFVFSFTTRAGDENCQADLIDVLIEKGFMNEEVCYDFNPAANKLSVVINGMIYNMGAFDLDENRKSVDERFYKQEGACKLTETNNVTANPSKPDASEKNSINSAKDSLGLIAKLMDVLTPGVPAGQKIEISGTGYADGVNNKMEEFDNFDECLKNETYQKALKAPATGDNWKVISNIRNVELAKFRADQHVDHIIANTEVATKSVIQKNKSKGESSPELQFQYTYFGWCDMRRGATLEAKIPGLEKRSEAKMPAAVEVQFVSPQDPDYNILEVGSGYRIIHGKRLLNKLFDLNCASLCPSNKYTKVDVGGGGISGPYYKCLETNYEKQEANWATLRKCIGTALKFNESDYDSEALGKYKNFFKYSSDLNKKTQTIKQVTTAMILRGWDSIFTVDKDDGPSYRDDASDGPQYDVSDQFATWINKITSNFKGQDFFTVCAKKPALRDANWLFYCSMFKPITSKVNQVTYDPWKIKAANNEVYKNYRGFFHTACSSGVAITKGPDKDTGKRQFTLRTFQIEEKLTPRHDYDLTGGLENNSEHNQFMAKLYNVYDETNMSKFNPFFAYSLQHPTMYVLPGCADCKCLLDGVTGSTLRNLVAGGTRVNFSNDFTEKEKDKTPIKIIKGIDNMSGKQSSCLFMPAVFAAHVAGKGETSTILETYDPPVLSSSCNELIKLIKSVQTLKAAPAPDKKAAIKNHCKSYIEKFPFSQPLCISNCSPKPNGYDVDTFKQLLKGEKRQDCKP